MQSIEDLRNMRIDQSGLRLRDIATVIHDVPTLTTGRFLNGEPAVAFWIQKSSDANVVDVCRRVRVELERIQEDPALRGLETIVFLDQGKEITGSLRDLLVSGLQGSLLAVMVLFFFLRRVSTTLIVSVAIPFSIIATASFLFLTGRSLNVLTMMGLMLAVGMLVDNAIVVLEAIYRHQQGGETPQRAAAIGASEVGMAVAASTLTSVCVFAPVVFGGKNEIMVWLSEVGITISVTLIFSLVIALTLIPLMCTRIAGNQAATESQLLARTARVYLKVLRWTAVRHPWRTLLLLFGTVIMTVVVGKVTGFKMEPDSDRGMRREQLEITFEFTDNMNYVLTREAVQKVEAVLLAKKADLGIESLYSYYGDNRARAYVFFEDAPLSEKRIKEIRKALREVLPEVPGAKLRLGGEEEAGIGAERLEVTLFGEDSDLLGEYAQEAKRRLSLIGDLEDVSTDAEGGKEEIALPWRQHAALPHRRARGAGGGDSRPRGSPEYRGPDEPAGQRRGGAGSHPRADR
jgi:HAE1 family hydrophobic/amphiphilic exporter-1